MKYPEMVRYFTEMYDPRKESILHFMTRKKSHHEQFLRKRGWSREEIDAAWADIIRSLSRKKVTIAEVKRREREAREEQRKFEKIRALLFSRQKKRESRGLLF